MAGAFVYTGEGEGGQVPAQFEKEDVRERLRKMPGGPTQPLTVHLRQEIDRLNIVIALTSLTLKNLRLAIAGVCTALLLRPFQTYLFSLTAALFLILLLCPRSFSEGEVQKEGTKCHSLPPLHRTLQCAIALLLMHSLARSCFPWLPSKGITMTTKTMGTSKPSWIRPYLLHRDKAAFAGASSAVTHHQEACLGG